MQYRQRSRAEAMAGRVRRARRQAGFTLIELMIGVLVGLLTTLAVSIVVIKFEGMRRTTVTGSDAQVTGALAIDSIQRHVMSAGYGFTQVAGLMGCTLSGVYNGKSVELPPQLVPVQITSTAGAPDKLRVFYSGKTSFSVPVRMKEGYEAGKSTQFTVTSTLGVAPPVPSAYPGDLILAGSAATAPCQIFRPTAVVAPDVIKRADDSGGWNAPGFPTQSYGKDDFLVNLGTPRDLEFSVSDKKALVVRQLRIDTDGIPRYEGPSELASNVVDMRVFYGRDNTVPDADGSVDQWTTVAPTDNDGWQRVLAVRVALVTRSAQFEREDVTQEAPYWYLGTVVPTVAADLASCDAKPPCVRFRVEDVADWKRYRYKVLETVIPLRNLVWRTAT